MENASKALIIAASVLIVILLIAFAMKLLNSTSGIEEDVISTMSAAEIASFNSKFTSYVGTKSIAQVRALADLVIASNAVSSNKVSFNSKTAASDISGVVENLTANLYKVQVGYDASGKLVSAITVSLPTT